MLKSFLKILPSLTSEQENGNSVIFITDSKVTYAHICNYQTINLTKMGLRSLLGFGEKRKMVYDYLDKEALIIDIRTPETYAKGSLPGSMNMVLEYLDLEFERIREINKPILVVCGSGLRSDEGAVVLRRQGFEAINAGSYRRLKKLIETR